MQLTKRRMTLLGAVAAGVVLTGVAFRPSPVDVETVDVRSGPLMTTIDEDARTRVPERYEISSPVAGRQMRVEVHPGDAVEHGAADDEGGRRGPEHVERQEVAVTRQPAHDRALGPLARQER